MEEISFGEKSIKFSEAKINNNGSIGEKTELEEIIEEKSEEESDDNFTGHSCLLVTWKTNPEVEKFKVRKIPFYLPSQNCSVRRNSTWMAGDSPA